MDYQPLFFNLDATLSIDPRYRWEVVEAQVRIQLKAKFSFRQRDLAQPVTVSDIILVIQTVPGVVAIDVNNLYFSNDVTALHAMLSAEVASVSGPQDLRSSQLLMITEDDKFILLREMGAS